MADVPAPSAGPGQVLVRNRAAGLNFFDTLQVGGKYQIKPPFPFTPGAEVAGTVESAGAGVTHVKTGDRVMALPHWGGFSEFSLAGAERVFPIPDGMNFATAASIPLVYQTSYFALTLRAALRPREWLLVHAGASGVGASAIQLGRAFGANVIATAGSAEKLEFARRQGAAHTLDYSEASWVDRVKELTGGRGADVIYDPVGGDIFDLSSKCIAPEGRLLVIGFASGRIPSIAANRILLKDIAVVGAVWGGYVQRHPEYLAEAHGALMELYGSGRIQPPAPKTYAFEDAPAALRDLANRKVPGKAALSW